VAQKKHKTKNVTLAGQAAPMRVSAEDRATVKAAQERLRFAQEQKRRTVAEDQLAGIELANAQAEHFTAMQLLAARYGLKDGDRYDNSGEITRLADQAQPNGAAEATH
jgi:hypothetical protein